MGKGTGREHYQPRIDFQLLERILRADSDLFPRALIHQRPAGNRHTAVAGEEMGLAATKHAIPISSLFQAASNALGRERGCPEKWIAIFDPLLDTSLTCGNSMRLKINPCVFQQVPSRLLS